MKIWAPICSASAIPFVAMAPLAGAGMPRLSRSHAVCSVELPLPPHHKVERCPTMLLSHVLPISAADRSGLAPCSSSARRNVNVPAMSSSVTTKGSPKRSCT